MQQRGEPCARLRDLSSRDLESHRGSHGRRHDSKHARRWCSSAYVNQSLARASVKGPGFSNDGPHVVGDRGTLDCLRAGKVDQARAWLNIAVLIVDQVSIDKGSWLLAQELSLEVGPPMSSFRKHEVASSAGDPAYSRLLDPRWAEVALAKLREEADFLDRRQKLSSRRRGQLK